MMPVTWSVSDAPWCTCEPCGMRPSTIRFASSASPARRTVIPCAWRAAVARLTRVPSATVPNWRTSDGSRSDSSSLITNSPLAERAVDDHLFQCALEHGELLVVQLRREQLGDCTQMDRYGLGHARHAGLRQRTHDTTSIALGGGPATQSPFHQPDDAPPQPRPRPHPPPPDPRPP